MQLPHNDTFSDVTGVILAGGRSSRMGRDKATLPLAGERLFDRVRRSLAALLPQLLIAGDRPDLATAGLSCHADLYPGSALGGLYTGLYYAPTPYIFACACDMPWPDPQVIRALLSRRQGHDVVLLRGDEGLEPLFAVYGKGCLEPIRQLLESGCFRIYDFFRQVRVCELTAADLPAGWRRAVTNLNTPEELRRAGEEL
jgi:molybdopterin-guanine dinucleotide biosynthesis protein A